MRFSSRFRIKHAKTSVFFEFSSLLLLDSNFDKSIHQISSDYVIQTNDCDFIYILCKFVCMNWSFFPDAIR